MNINNHDNNTAKSHNKEAVGRDLDGQPLAASGVHERLAAHQAPRIYIYIHIYTHTKYMYISVYLSLYICIYTH